MRRNLHLDDGAVLQSVAPNAGFIEPLGDVSNVVFQTLNIGGGSNVGNRHLQKFRARVSVFHNGSIIHGEERQGLQVVHPHGMGIALKEEAILPFVFTQSVF